MSAPRYVPSQPAQRVRSYTSPPHSPDSWLAERPGDLEVGQPEGSGLGSQGPDQGYVFVLARTFGPRLLLTDGEKRADAIAGCCAVALKRASLFGRAPVIHDLTVAATVWGLLDEEPDDELVFARRELFEEVANPHHYEELRRIVDKVPANTLRLTHQAVEAAHAKDWRNLLGEL